VPVRIVPAAPHPRVVRPEDRLEPGVPVRRFKLYSAGHEPRQVRYVVAASEAEATAYFHTVTGTDAAGCVALD